MFKLAGRVLDFYDDPDFVTNLTAQRLFGSKLYAPEQVHELPDRMFAVKIATRHGDVRKWPVFNKLATKLSGAYFDEAAPTLPDELRKVAGFFLKQAHEAFSLPLPASLNAKFEHPAGGFKWDSEAWEKAPDEMEAPALDALAKQAQVDFLQGLRNLSPKERFEQANAIFDLCKRAQCDLDHRVWNYVEKERHGPYLKSEIQARATMIKEASSEVLAETFVKTLAGLTDRGLRTFADTIMSFDKQAGLDREWDRRLKDPYEAVFGGLEMKKQASKETDVLKWKLETLRLQPKELERIFEPLFVNRFIDDPVGVYKAASPLTKKIILSLVKRLPTPSTGEVKAHLTEEYKREQHKMPLDWTLESVGKAIAEGRNGGPFCG